MRFEIKAVRNADEIGRMTIEAGDAAEARRMAGAQGWSVLTIKSRNRLAGLMPRLTSTFALDLFAQELISLLDAGLTLVEAIETLAEKEQGKAASAVLAELREELHRGRSFSQALAQLPRCFPLLFVATVQAAEKTGDIREALGRYLDYHAQLERVRQRIVAASIYPLLLLFVGGLVSLFTLFYVVPKFSRIYDELGGNLPWLTRVLIDWGQLLESHAAVLLAGIAALAVGAGMALARPQTRRWIGRRLWRLPALGERMRAYELARFYRTLGMLLKSGVALPVALEMASGLLSPVLQGGLRAAARAISEGKPTSAALHGEGFTTPVALRLLGVGERSGRMPHMVERIALFYEDETARWVEWFTRLFEPALMLVIGAIVGMILVMLYLPIFELAENIR